MKISISIPAPLFNTAEKLAKRMGISQSEFYQYSIRLFIEQHRTDNVTESLDALYGSAGTESELDSAIEQIQNVSLATTDW